MGVKNEFLRLMEIRALMVERCCGVENFDSVVFAFIASAIVGKKEVER